MTGTDLCVNKPQSVPVIFQPPCIMKLTLRKNYDTLIPNLDGKYLNHFAMLKKTSDNFYTYI